MGFYDNYRARMECSKSSSEKLEEDIMDTIKDNFFGTPTESVYRNDDSSTLYLSLIHI